MTARSAPPLPQVYSAAEIADAAGVRSRDVRALAAAGVVATVDGKYFGERDAVQAVRWLSSAGPERALFRPAAGVRRQPALPAALTGAVHIAVLAIAVLLAGIHTANPQNRIARIDPEMRLVFLVSPGPGGGGGGGGHHDETPPPPAQRKGTSTLHSPIPVRRPIHVEAPKIVRAVDPPKAEPPVVAPVIPVAADIRDRVGVPVAAKAPVIQDSNGPGVGGGTGTGRGTGVGEGDGNGIGPGSGGGTGGGPYRPGSGITAPTILREVKPDYTEEGRRRNVEGDVVVEIIVKSDGTVGNVKLLQGLGAGLDQRAIDAVRQWRFSPARRLGTPVDVVVEVAVEFKLR
jgi:periplasmic protein TonB